MFTIGQKLVYKNSGLCVYEGVQDKILAGRSVSYHVLTPCTKTNSTVLIPCDNPQLTQQMRPMMTQQQARELLDGAAQTPDEWLDKERERTARFRGYLSEYDRSGLVRILRTLTHRRQQVEPLGRRLFAGDEKLLKEVQALLCCEIAESLSLTEDEILSRLLAE